MTDLEIVAGKYRLIRKLGEGGMGSVWEAQHLALGTSVALKLLGEEFRQDEHALRRFRREAKVTANLRCNNVVQVYDHDVANGVPYMVMERLVGETLEERLSRCGKLEPHTVMNIFEQLEQVLTRVHSSGVVHRDIKPGNVFLARDAHGGETVKLLDFGVAKHLRAPEFTTQLGIAIGTPCYMSPEQARGEAMIDHRADLWALGVVAYECLTGRRPFEHESLRNLVRMISSGTRPVPVTHTVLPAGFDAWFLRAVDPILERRFSSVSELVTGLRRALLDRVGGSTRRTAAKLALATTRATWRPAVRARRGTAIAHALFALFVVAGTGLTFAVRSYATDTVSPAFGAHVSVLPSTDAGPAPTPTPLRRVEVRPTARSRATVSPLSTTYTGREVRAPSADAPSEGVAVTRR